jgi:hypothetical protein
MLPRQPKVPRNASSQTIGDAPSRLDAEGHSQDDLPPDASELLNLVDRVISFAQAGIV